MYSESKPAPRRRTLFQSAPTNTANGVYRGTSGLGAPSTTTGVQLSSSQSRELTDDQRQEIKEAVSIIDKFYA